MKQQINFRSSNHTTDQLQKLITKTGLNQTEVIAIAIDRMFTQEIKMNADEIYDRYANQATPIDLLKLGRKTIARQLMELDGELDTETANDYANKIRTVAISLLCANVEPLCNTPIDGDTTLEEWLDAGQYDGTETPEGLAEDWDDLSK